MRRHLPRLLALASACAAAPLAAGPPDAPPPPPLAPEELAVPEAGPRWIEFPTPGLRFRAFYDRASGRREGDLVRLSGRLVYRTSGPMNAAVALFDAEIECGPRILRFRGYRAYGADGRFLRAATLPPDAAATTMPANSPGAPLHEEFCRQ